MKGSNMSDATKNIFGFSTEPSNGEEYFPIVKYDARAGRMFRVDKNDNWLRVGKTRGGHHADFQGDSRSGEHRDRAG